METQALFSLKKNETTFKKTKITSPSDAYEVIRQYYGDDIEIYESVFILLLNAANDTIGFAKISQGGILGTVIDVRLIAKYAVESLAASVILAHNHPTGRLLPSDADDNVTKKTKAALNTLDILLQDHLIITKDSFYSYANQGRIDNF